MPLSGTDFSGFARTVNSFESAQHVLTEKVGIEAPFAIDNLSGGGAVNGGASVSSLILSENPNRTFLMLSNPAQQHEVLYIGLGEPATLDGLSLEIPAGATYLFANVVPTCAVYVASFTAMRRFIVYENPAAPIPPVAPSDNTLDYSNAVNSMYVFLLFGW